MAFSLKFCCQAAARETGESLATGHAGEGGDRHPTQVYKLDSTQKEYEERYTKGQLYYIS
jgi:hypothetical protein